ncbi:glycosyltransferase [Clostridium sp.]|uniref:glycosyltransferase n=1 Tax=Clostridium sp. TaxID=1506 RepID=UPI002609F836|nr:glycosyltransferase [Clostridium sp.]
MIKVLHVLASLEGSGGVQKRLIDNYYNMNRSEVKFDFIVHGYDIGELEESIKKIGCNIYHVPRKRGLGLFKNITNINNIIRDGKYDIVQSHMEHAGAIVLSIAKKHRIKVRIAHSHLANIYSKGIVKKIKRICTYIINLTATDYWACSNEAGVWLFGNKVIEEKKLKVIPNAIDVNRFKLDEKKRLEYRKELNLKNQFTLVNVGRLSYQKNHEFLFQIFKEVLNLESNSKLLLVGDGELKAELYEKVKEINIENDVIFLGTREDVYNILQAADVMLHPALFEGLGNVLIEAQAAGLPIIASDEGIPKETKITEIIKYISLKENKYIWAEEIINLKNFDRIDTSELVKKANFDCKEQAIILQELYKELVKNTSKG